VTAQPEPDDYRTAPHDIDTERAVLGLCLSSPQLLTRAAETLAPTDFYRAAHASLWSLLIRERDAGRATDLVAMNVAVQAVPDLRRIITTDKTWLHTIWRVSNETAPAYLESLAGKLVDYSRRRSVIEVAGSAIQNAHEYENAETVIEHAADAINALRYAPQTDDELASLHTLDEFCDRPMPDRVWVLGHLLARGERVVITGTEGAGKSTMGRQCGVAAAAGIDPFTLAPCQPVRVLAIDLENPEDLMIESWSGFRAAAARRGRPVKDGMLWIDRRPDGLDLADVRDQRWLRRRVEAITPQLLVIGPVYKMYVGGDTQREETVARLVTAYLDKLRVSTGEWALILEHHSPHSPPTARQRPTRPIGSSLWMRWPEFGIGIRPALDAQDGDRRLMEVESWRGPRAQRPWPKRIEEGTNGWAWTEAAPEGAWR
jgi:hypothetical protein